MLGIPTPRFQGDFRQYRVNGGIKTGHSAAQNDPELMRSFLEVFLIPCRDQGCKLILRGPSRSTYSTHIDRDLIIDPFTGPIYFRAFSNHAPLNERFARELADQIPTVIRP